MTADGRYIAFNTVRTRIRAAEPTSWSTLRRRRHWNPRSTCSISTAMEIERASRAWDGGEINEDTLDGLSISDDGARIAFASQASNLFFGDGNGYPDAFVLNRAQPGAGRAGRRCGAAFRPPVSPADQRRAGRADLRAREERRRGSVTLAVRVTGAGLVEARTLSRVRTSRKGSAARHRCGRLRVPERGTAGGEVTLVLRTLTATARYLPKRGRLTRAPAGQLHAAGGGRRITARRNVALQPEEAVAR